MKRYPFTENTHYHDNVPRPWLWNAKAKVTMGFEYGPLKFHS